MLTKMHVDKDLERICILSTLKMDDMIENTGNILKSPVLTVKYRKYVEEAIKHDKLNIQAIEKMCVLEGDIGKKAKKEITGRVETGEMELNDYTNTLSEILEEFDNCIYEEQMIGKTYKEAHDKCIDKLLK